MTFYLHVPQECLVQNLTPTCRSCTSYESSLKTLMLNNLVWACIFFFFNFSLLLFYKSSINKLIYKQTYGIWFLELEGIHILITIISTSTYVWILSQCTCTQPVVENVIQNEYAKANSNCWLFIHTDRNLKLINRSRYVWWALLNSNRI